MLSTPSIPSHQQVNITTLSMRELRERFTIYATMLPASSPSQQQADFSALWSIVREVHRRLLEASELRKVHRLASVENLLLSKLFRLGERHRLIREEHRTELRAIGSGSMQQLDSALANLRADLGA